MTKPDKKNIFFSRLMFTAVAVPILLMGILIARLVTNKSYALNIADLFIIAFAVVSALFTIRQLYRISLGIKKAHQAVSELSHGGFPEEKLSTSGVLGTLEEDLNALKGQLRAKADFANAIGRGDLSAFLDNSGQNSPLDLALLGIKENLVRLKKEEQQREWTTEALGKFVDILRINKDLKELSGAIIGNLVKTLRANQGAIFILTKDQDGNEFLEMEACYAYNKSKQLTKKVEIGEGLIGQTFLEKETVHLKKVPENFVSITSGLGDANPRNVLIIPLKMNDVVTGIIELAAFHEFARHEIDFAERIGESIAHAITSFRVAENTKTLLKEASEQAEHLRSQEEELRQNQEEMQATQEEIARKYDALFNQLRELNYESKFDQLRSITFTRKRNIEYYFDIIRNQIITFAENKMIREAMQGFISAFHTVAENVPDDTVSFMKEELLQYYEKEFLPRLNDNTYQTKQTATYFPEGAGAMILQDLYISRNPHPTGKKSLLDDPGDGSDYSRVHALYHPIIRSYLEKFGYYDIFLLDSNTGDLVYSVFKEVDYATNLISGLYSATNFGKVVQEAIASRDKDFVKLIDFETYDPSYGAPASFIARPVYEGNIKIGIVVFQMPIHKVNQILTGDNHWREDGLGKSGETFMVGDDYRLRSVSRSLIEDPENYLSLLKKQGYEESVQRLIRKTGTNILLEKVQLDCVTKALTGISGRQRERNAFGIECLYTFAPLAIPDVNWVIMSSLNEAEASDSIENLRKV